MLRIALMLCLLVCLPAEAGLEFAGKDRQGRPTALRLSEAPCSSAVILGHLKARELPEKVAQRFKASVLTWGGRDWQACWLKVWVINDEGEREENIYAIDEEGDTVQPPSGLPLRLFRENSL